MATLGNRVGEQQWDVYDKLEVENKIVELAPSEINDNATTTTNTWSASKISTSKQDTLISGTNIKTINGTSVLGSGDLVVEGLTLAEAQATALCF